MLNKKMALIGNGKRKIVGTVTNTSTRSTQTVLITRNGKYNVIYTVGAQETLTCELEVGDVFYPNYNSNYVYIQYSNASDITLEGTFEGDGYDNLTVTAVEDGVSVSCYVPNVK